MSSGAERLADWAATLKSGLLTGIHFEHGSTYISGTGTAGTDNTAQAVKSVLIPAGTFQRVGDRMHVRCYFRATGGPPITGSVRMGPAGSPILVASTTANGTSLALTESWLHYLDPTHANVFEAAAGALGPASAVNVAGFAWTTIQVVTFNQSAASNQHLVLYALIVDIYTSGVTP